MQINSKFQFYSLWEAGVLGNRTKLFHSLEEALASKSDQIGFREIGKIGGKGAWTLVKMGVVDLKKLPTTFPEVMPFLEMSWKDFFKYEVRRTHKEWTDAGRRFIMDNSVPNNKSTCQGEVCRTERGMESYIVVGNGIAPMRETMAAGLHRHRGYLETKIILDRCMDPSSRDDLDMLFELYPDSTIEFTSFSVNVGEFPHRNTIFWEVRSY